MDKKYVVAILGAQGAVGAEMIKTLEKRNFPVKELILLGATTTIGKKVKFKDSKVTIKAADKEAFNGVDIAIFAASGTASAELAPAAVDSGAIVIDNSSYWRMNDDCPLVVPEVNPQDLDWHKGIIANPNCSTTQMVVALKPIHDAAKIKRIVVSTYQAVSGGGKKALMGLFKEADDYAATGTVNKAKVYTKQILFNLIPHIDLFLEDGYTKEEHKMVDETHKILSKDIAVTATCVRVPVVYGHSEAINIETEKKLSSAEVRELLANAPGIKVVDNPAKTLYPTPKESDDEDAVLIGRIREDLSIENGINIWCVANNIKKGAALNAIQIAETLIERKLI